MECNNGSERGKSTSIGIRLFKTLSRDGRELADPRRLTEIVPSGGNDTGRMEGEEMSSKRRYSAANGSVGSKAEARYDKRSVRVDDEEGDVGDGNGKAARTVRRTWMQGTINGSSSSLVSIREGMDDVDSIPTTSTRVAGLKVTSSYI